MEFFNEDLKFYEKFVAGLFVTTIYFFRHKKRAKKKN